MLTVKVVNDPDPENPRDWDNLGTMVCWHKRYNLGDHHDIDDDKLWSWDAIENHLRKRYKAHVILPLYLYDHSGITIRTTPFSCKWDSGQVGFIYATKEKIRKYYEWKKITIGRQEIIRQHLIREVNIYDAYLTGEVYGFEIIDEETEEVVDSCYGYYSNKDAKESGEEALCELQS